MKRDDGPPTGSEMVGQTCSQQRFSSRKETGGGGLIGIGTKSSIAVPTNQQWIKGGGDLTGYLQYLQYFSTGGSLAHIIHYLPLLEDRRNTSIK
jgi:hypothetical protein